MTTSGNALSGGREWWVCKFWKRPPNQARGKGKSGTRRHPMPEGGGR